MAPDAHNLRAAGLPPRPPPLRGPVASRKCPGLARWARVQASLSDRGPPYGSRATTANSGNDGSNGSPATSP